MFIANRHIVMERVAIQKIFTALGVLKSKKAMSDQDAQVKQPGLAL